MKRKNVLIMFAAMVLFVVVGTTSVLAQKSNYVYNCEWDNEALKSKIIYKYSNDSITLIPYKKGDFTYDKDNYIQSKTVYYWNSAQKSWEKASVYTYEYTDGRLMVEMARYRTGNKNILTGKERSIYEIDDSWNLLSCRTYKWKVGNGLWILKNEIKTDGTVSLLGNNNVTEASINKMFMAM